MTVRHVRTVLGAETAGRGWWTADHTAAGATHTPGAVRAVEHVAAAAELGTEVEKVTWAEMEAAKVVVVVAAA